MNRIKALIFSLLIVGFLFPAELLAEDEFLALLPIIDLTERTVISSPMIQSRPGLQIGGMFNPGWLINHRMLLGFFLSYTNYFYPSCTDDFLDFATSQYSAVDYQNPDLQTTMEFFISGEVKEISDHRWGIVFMPPITGSPIFKPYWLMRNVIVANAGTGAFLGDDYSLSYGLSMMGAGLEVDWQLLLNEKLPWWLRLMKISAFAQWVSFKTGMVDGPNPALGEWFTEEFSARYGDFLEFGFSVGIGI